MREVSQAPMWGRSPRTANAVPVSVKLKNMASDAAAAQKTSTTPEISDSLREAGFTPTSTPQVLTARTGSLGRIMLNNPRAINALTLEMVTAVKETLDAWRDDDSITTVSIEGAGERGLCAGGDVVSVRSAYLDNPDSAADFANATKFFSVEYSMNAAIADYPKLIVALQDGIVMGGGIGISAYCGLRLATERTKVAMPETIIGFFPDVGALYLLAHAPGGTGAYLALTGSTITGRDAVFVGFSDAVIESISWPTILERLADGADADAAIEGLTVSRETFAAEGLAAEQSWINECFGQPDAGRTASQIRDALHASSVAKAREAGDLLDARSPLSVAVTLEALRRAAGMGSVHEVLAQDEVLAANLLLHGDFAEGVRAQLVDKDRSPKWPVNSVDDITDEQVQRMFERP